MLKIKIISIGKTKESWLSEAIEEYAKRLKPVALLEFLWVKNDEQLKRSVEGDLGVICLDPLGKMMTSEEFSTFFEERLETHGSRITVVIGGSEGLPADLKTHYPLISLSRLTFTHQLTRLILVEQIYRAFEIARGSQYHK